LEGFKYDSNEPWKTEILADAEERRLSHPPIWQFKRYETNIYNIQTYDLNSDAEANVFCRLKVEDLKVEQKNSNAEFWSTIYNSGNVQDFCNGYPFFRSQQDSKLLLSRVLMVADIAAPECSWSYRNKLDYHYTVTTVVPMRTKLAYMSCDVYSKTDQKLQSAKSTFAPIIERMIGSIIP
jgi:hypothetical protein